MSRAPSGLTVRSARRDDSERLGRFSCSTGAWYEDEVQDYIRERALGHAVTRPRIYRLLLAFDARELVAVGAHAPEALVLPDDVVIATRIQVLALATAAHGRVLSNGARLSDAMMATLIQDIIQHGGRGLVTAIAADENLRSIAMCERNGLRSQTRYAPRYVRLTGTLGRPDGSALSAAG